MNPELPNLATRADQVAPTGELSGEDGSLARDVRSYLQNVISNLHASAVPNSSNSDPATVAAGVVDRLFSRPYSYLGRSRASIYEDAIRDAVVRAAEHEAPIPFYFDIGGGYHAAISPGQQNLCFNVGLGELFVLGQIAHLCRDIAQVYASGLRFSLVIDNLCALLVNDIPLAKTLEYCARLRRLVAELRLTDVVSVLVESEHFSEAEVAEAALSERPAEPKPVTAQRHRNVERFLGRPCTEQEVLEREARYHVIVSASERLLGRVIDGIHMTQRASSTTMCFRPFPGGDSRIQSGQVVMTRNAKGILHPILLTSANVDRYACTTFRFADLLPSEVHHVIFADPVEALALPGTAPQD